MGSTQTMGLTFFRPMDMDSLGPSGLASYFYPLQLDSSDSVSDLVGGKSDAMERFVVSGGENKTRENEEDMVRER